MVEGAVPNLELPIAVILGRPQAGQDAELLVVGDPIGPSLDDHVEPGLPGVRASRQRAVGVSGQVDGLLLARAGAEVKGVVMPDRGQRCDVDPSISAHGRDPEELRFLEHVPNLGPGRRRRVRPAETGVQLSDHGQRRGRTRRGCGRTAAGPLL